MVYNYSVKPGESMKIKTPGNNSFDDITKHLKSNGEVIINHSLYPDGFEVKMTQIGTDKIIITTNEIRHSNGVLNSSQYNSLKSYDVSLKSYIDKVTGVYEVYYSNENITSELKTELKESHNDFILQYENFSNVIINKLGDYELSSNDGNALTLYLNEFRSACNVLSSKLMSCINLISNKSIETSLNQIRTDLEEQIKYVSDKYDALNNKYNELQNSYNTLNNKYTELEQRIINLED